MGNFKHYIINKLYNISQKITKQLLTLQNKIIMDKVQEVKDALVTLSNAITAKSIADIANVTALEATVGLSEVDKNSLIAQINIISASLTTTSSTTVEPPTMPAPEIIV